MKKEISEELQKKLTVDQQNEIDSHHIYNNMAKKTKNNENRKILEQIADDEMKHYKLLTKYTGVEPKPNSFKVAMFSLITTIFGLTFGLKLMEKLEKKAHKVDYAGLGDELHEIRNVMKDEEEHERELLNMINEDHLKYVGSVVLGLNDALVELTGALAGLTFALQNTSLIALTGLITGIAASFSMASSEYLSTKADGDDDALKSALYTGVAYIVTVFLLILPYLLIKNYIVCLVLTLIISVLIIFVFNYYISVAKDYNFKKRFFEMTLISLGIAGLSFLVGIVIRSVFHVDI